MNTPAAPTVHTAMATYNLVLAGSTVECMSMMSIAAHDLRCLCMIPIMSGYERMVVNIPSFEVLAPCLAAT